MKDAYGEVYIKACTYNNTKYPFVVLNPCYFKRGIEYMIEILIHEMVHIYCSVHKIEEINYYTGYHNKMFKLICDKINLKCKKSKNGYDNTSYTPELKNEVNKMVEKTDLVYLLANYNYNI